MYSALHKLNWWVNGYHPAINAGRTNRLIEKNFHKCTQECTVTSYTYTDYQRKDVKDFINRLGEHMDIIWILFSWVQNKKESHTVEVATAALYCILMNWAFLSRGSFLLSYFCSTSSPSNTTGTSVLKDCKVVELYLWHNIHRMANC